MAHKQLKARPCYATPLKLPTGLQTGARDVFAFGAHGWGAKARESVGQAGGGGKVCSAFAVPGMHLLPGLLLGRSGLHRLYNADAHENRLVVARQLASDNFDVSLRTSPFEHFVGGACIHVIACSGACTSYR